MDCIAWRVVRDANGTAVRMIGTHSDITERKRAEEILKNSESRLRAAFSSSYSFLVLLQPDGTIIEAALDAAGEMLRKWLVASSGSRGGRLCPRKFLS